MHITRRPAIIVAGDSLEYARPWFGFAKIVIAPCRREVSRKMRVVGVSDQPPS
jgi:hypothetical protein